METPEEREKSAQIRNNLCARKREEEEMLAFIRFHRAKTHLFFLLPHLYPYRTFAHSYILEVIGVGYQQGLIDSSIRGIFAAGK